MIIFLFIIALALPAYQIRFNVFSFPFTLLETLILLCFFIWFIKNGVVWIKTKQWPKIEQFFPRPWFYLIILWLIISLISAFYSFTFPQSLGLWKAYFLEPILLLIVLLDTLKKNKKTLGLVLFGLAFSALYCSVWAMGQKWPIFQIFGFNKISGGIYSPEVFAGKEVWRATGPFPQPNFLGLYLGPIIILSLGQFINYFKKNYKLTAFYLLTFLLSLFTIILAKSEGAILGVLVGLIFFALINKKSRYWTIAVLAIGILIGLILPAPRHYLTQKITFNGLSEQIRLNIWQSTANLIEAHPILGVGLRSYQTIIPQYQKPFYPPNGKKPISIEAPLYPHNLFLALWSELGILGLIIFLCILIKFFLQGFKNKNTFNLVLMAAMIVILIHGLVDTPYFKNDLAILFWFIIGIMITNNQQLTIKEKYEKQKTCF